VTRKSTIRKFAARGEPVAELKFVLPLALRLPVTASR